MMHLKCFQYSLDPWELGIARLSKVLLRTLSRGIGQRRWIATPLDTEHIPSQLAVNMTAKLTPCH
jgi:hypothetical protein